MAAIDVTGGNCGACGGPLVWIPQGLMCLDCEELRRPRPGRPSTGAARGARVGARLHERALTRFDETAAARGLDRSGAVREALAEWTAKYGS